MPIAQLSRRDKRKERERESDKMNKNHRHTGGAIEANIKHHTIRYA